MLKQRQLGYRAVQVLAYVEQRITEHGEAPSYGMICAATGISSRAHVNRIVKALEARGIFTRKWSGQAWVSTSRRIRLVGRV